MKALQFVRARLGAALSYLWARMQEPGTISSLIWVCISVAALFGGSPNLLLWLVAGVALGLVSALWPERK